MPVNIEIKAHLRNRESVERNTAKAADSGPILLVQEDTFLTAGKGASS